MISIGSLKWGKADLPVSRQHKARTAVEAMSYDEFVYIARRVPKFFVLRYIESGFIDLLGIQELPRCRDLSRKFDRHADELERQVEAASGAMTVEDITRVCAS